VTAARSYRSPLRDEQARQTRVLILDALVDLVATQGVADPPVRDLAELAGVSERTVYRHFPDRAALLDGLADHVADSLGWALRHDEVETLDDLVETIPASFAGFDEHETKTRALVLLNLDPARVANLTRRNQENLREAVAEELSHLDADEQAEAVAVLHLLASSRTWLRFRQQDGLAPGQAGRAAQRAARAVLADLRADATASR
jgi:AcrR family transcriptional regulator